MNGASAQEKPPIFVAGNPRSGTTLMRSLLSAHPNIYILHEPWFYTWNSLCPKDVSGEQFLKYYFDTFSFKWLQLRPADVLDALPASFPRDNVRIAFREIMRQKAEAAGKPRYGEKTPGNSYDLPSIFRDFPDSPVIVMVRDPRSTVDSTRKMVWGSQTDLANCIAYEISRREADKFKNRVLFVKLEDLRLNPEAELRRVLDYVGEPWDPAVLDHSKNNPWPGDMPPVPWLQNAAEPLVPTETRLPNMEPVRVRLVEMLCGKSMKRFGYEKMKLQDPPGNAAVYKRIASEIPETLRYAWTVTRMYGKLRKPEQWAVLSVYVTMFRGMNPEFWKDNPGIEIPLPPAFPEEKVYPPVRSKVP